MVAKVHAAGTCGGLFVPDFHFPRPFGFCEFGLYGVQCCLHLELVEEVKGGLVQLVEFGGDVAC